MARAHWHAVAAFKGGEVWSPMFTTRRAAKSRVDSLRVAPARVERCESPKSQKVMGERCEAHEKC